MDTDLLDRIAGLSSRLSVMELSLDVRLSAAEKALMLQAQEYARRLDYLNGEAERLRQMQVTYLPREVWEAEYRRLRADVESLVSFRDASVGRYSVIAIMVSAVVSVFVGLLVHLWST